MFYKKIILAISVLFLSACASSKAVPATEITVDMNEFSYTPASITIPANQPVVLTIKNSGTQEHDFVIKEIAVTMVGMDNNVMGQHEMTGDPSEYALHTTTAVGATSTLSFTATEPGTYKIFCSIQGHEIAGMIGELVVVEE